MRLGGQYVAKAPPMIQSRGRAPETAVVRGSTIVAHHEVVIGGNRDLPRVVAPLGALAGERERLALALAVEDDVAVDDGHPVARARHDALDEVDVRALGGGLVARLAGGRRAAAALVVGLRAGRRVEDDDVADVRVGEAGADAVDQHPLADLERRHHRLRRDPVRLDEERLDAEREPEGHRDDQDQLEERAGRRRPALHLYFSASAAEASGPRRHPGRRRSVASLSPRRGSPRALVPGLRLGASARRRAALGRCRFGAPGSWSRPACTTSSGSASGARAHARACRCGRAGSRAWRGARRRGRRPRSARSSANGAGTSLHADAEGLLADGEGLTDALTLALDHDTLEDLRAAARALDDLEVDAHAVARLELRTRRSCARSRLSMTVLMARKNREAGRLSRGRLMVAKRSPAPSRLAGRDCSSRHSRMRAWCPLSRTSGTVHPRHSAGACSGGTRAPLERRARRTPRRADSSCPSAPGACAARRRTTTIAASSPPGEHVAADRQPPR